MITSIPFWTCPICGGGVPIVPYAMMGDNNECSIIGHFDECHNGIDMFPVGPTNHAECLCGKRFRDNDAGVGKLEAHLRTCDLKRHLMLATLKNL